MERGAVIPRLEKALCPSYTRRQMSRFSLFPARWMACLVAITAPLHALEIKQAWWGFDGDVVSGCFSPLSVLVSNPEDAPFDGALSLSATEGVSVERGAEYVQPVSLAPHASRWVQFYVQAWRGRGSHVLRWGRGAKESYELDGSVQQSAPARVWLRAAENPSAVAGSLKSFPEALFPVTASAAEGLDAVVLDHVPHWEPARREAFLDWLRLGGTVHLLPGADGKLPVFGEDLAALDTTADDSRVGLGRVVHHQIAPGEMNESYLAAHGFPARTVNETEHVVVYDLDAALFRALSGLTRPKVNWTFINLLVLAYVAVIGPVHSHYRQRVGYRLSIAIFLGCVGAFGTGLAVTGRRGYGESQAVHSLAIAHALGGGRADVTQWMSAFATRGDRYTLTHLAPFNLYATMSDAVSGLLFNGQDGHLLLDIPLYSSVAFLHRAIMTGDDTSLTVEHWEPGDSTMQTLRLRTAAGFPPHPAEIRVVDGGVLREFVERDGLLEPSDKPAEPLASYFSDDKMRPYLYGPPSKHFDNQGLLNLMPLLAARALCAPDVFPTSISPPPHRADLQLLVVAPIPASFALQGHGFTHESGWVLYVQDVFKP